MRLQIACLALAAIVFAGCKTTTGFSPETTTGFSPGSGDYDHVPDGEKAQATFSGGDGSSIERAVIITETASEKTGILAEYVWLHEHYPGYRLRGQMLRNAGGRAFDEMRIVSADGKSHAIFFDITSFFGKY